MMQEKNNYSQDLKEVRDLLSNLSDELIKECYNIAGVPYNAEDKKPRSITLLLTSEGIDKHLTKIKKIARSGITLRKADETRAETQPMPACPQDNLPRERNPYYRELADVAKKESPSLKVTAATDTECLSTYAYIGVNNGWTVLKWEAPNVESYDWVGLFDNQEDDQNTWLSWTWVKGHSEYRTSNYFYSGLSVRYYRWIDDRYVELYRSNDLNLYTVLKVFPTIDLYYGCWVSPTLDSNTYINWNQHLDVEKDYVGLYADDSENYKTWNWVNSSNKYDTKIGIDAGLHARYYKWDDSSKQYICKHSSIPFDAFYLDLQTLYPGMIESRKADSSNSIASILVDQLKLAIQGKPSVFSLNFGFMDGLPFGGKNLITNNLSYEEVKVIGSMLSPAQYYSCIMVYYKTYKMAIDIANDDERNAKRHVFWQISMAQTFGEEFALAIGEAHEKGRPGSQADNAADKYNNNVALAYWKEHPNDLPIDAANKLWDENKLKKIEQQRLRDEL